MTTAWDHLPNAAHIDRVLASAKANPDHWIAVADEDWITVMGEESGISLDAARDAAWDDAHETLITRERYDSYEAATDVSWHTIWDTLLALIAYDDCAYMLDSDPEDIAILATAGDGRAALLLGACKAFHSLKTIA